MIKTISIKHLLLWILLCQYLMAQANNMQIPDSLANKNFQYLSDKVIFFQNNKKKASKYAKAWVAKSKHENNWKQLAVAYRTTMYLQDKKYLRSYADSLLYAAIQTKDSQTIGTAYLTKGIMHYDQKELQKALDNYLLADKYLVQTEDKYSIYKVKYSIAHTKYYLGFYDEALSLFRECKTYFQYENDRAYLNSLHSIGLCYNRIGKYQACSVINKLGIKEGIKLENDEMEVYFQHSDGVNLYSQKQYKRAIDKLKAVLPTLKKKNDFANVSVAYFYTAKSFWYSNQKDTAMVYLKKVDSIFTKENYIRPDFREGYEILIKYYEKENNSKGQLYNINQLLKIDQILGQEYQYLLKKVVKEYDTK